jgi:dsDNA-specific endonuclease/ATPase MutS2
MVQALNEAGQWPEPSELFRFVEPLPTSVDSQALRSHPGEARAGGAVKLKLDLHEIYDRGEDIDRALRAIIDEAIAKKAPLVEIIPGKGSGALKKHVIRFLEQRDVKPLYHRLDKDSKNFGRVFVHFRWK